VSCSHLVHLCRKISLWYLKPMKTRTQEEKQEIVHKTTMFPCLQLPIFCNKSVANHTASCVGEKPMKACILLRAHKIERYKPVLSPKFSSAGAQRSSARAAYFPLKQGSPNYGPRENAAHEAVLSMMRKRYLQKIYSFGSIHISRNNHIT